jgi:hypothetical protein
LDVLQEGEIQQLKTLESDVAAGQVVLAKARELMHQLHTKFGHVVAVGSIQSMLRAGQPQVNNATVRDEMLRMAASELECDHCRLASTNRKHPSKNNSAKGPGTWTGDVSGKYWRSRRGNQYVFVMVAPEGKGIFTEFMRNKSEVLAKLKENRELWETKTGVKIVVLRMDRAGEHTSAEMQAYLKKEGIEASYTAPNSSAGAAEGYIHILQDAMRAMMNHYETLHVGHSAKHLWEYAFLYAKDCKTMTWCTTNDGMSMWEKRTGTKPPLHKLHVWGATVYVHLHDRAKGANRGRKGRFMGLARDGDGFIVFDPTTNSMLHAKSVSANDFEANEVPAPQAQASDKVGGDIQFVAPAEKTAHLFAKPAAAVEEKAPLREEQQIVEVGALEQGEEEAHEPEHDVLPARRERRQARPVNVGQEEWQVVPSTILSTTKQDNWHALVVTEQILVDKQKELHEQFLQLKKQERCLDARRAMVTKSAPLRSHNRRNAIGKKATEAFLKTREGNATFVHGHLVPRNNKEAREGPDREIWRAAEREEEKGMEEKEVMKLVHKNDVPRGARPVGSKFHYDIKVMPVSSTNMGPSYVRTKDGVLLRFKARWVAKGFTQVSTGSSANFDIDETYAPTPQAQSVRLVAAVGHQHRWRTRILDVKQAFLLAKLKETENIYMLPPVRDQLDSDYLYLLLRSIYGLRQAAHRWHRKMKATLIEHKFQCVDADQGIFVRYDLEGKLVCALALHVDDCMITAGEGLLDKTVEKLKRTYEMTEHAFDEFLKIKFTFSKDGERMGLSQPDYAAEIVRTMGFDPAASNSVTTPMEKILTKGEEVPMTEEEETFMLERAEKYGKVTGMLSYLMHCTRPDLDFSVTQIQSYTSCPRRTHWRALERVVRYLIGTQNHGIVFDRSSEQQSIVGYADSDWANCPDTRRSISGNIFMYLNGPVHWQSKKQKGKADSTDVARSTMESELRALDLAIRSGLWLREMGTVLRIPESETMRIYEDNEACFNWANNSQWSSQSKHVHTSYMACRGDIEKGNIDLQRIASGDNISDIFTKPLKRILFERFRYAMGMRDVSGI